MFTHQQGFCRRFRRPRLTTGLLTAALRYLGGNGAVQLPVPLMDVLNGGAPASNRLDFAEFMIVPAGDPEHSDLSRGALDPGAEVFHEPRYILLARGRETAVGAAGGFTPTSTLTSPRRSYALIRVRWGRRRFNTPDLRGMPGMKCSWDRRMPAIGAGTGKQEIDEPRIALSHDVDARRPVGSAHDVEAHPTIRPAHDVNASTVCGTHDRDQTVSADGDWRALNRRRVCLHYNLQRRGDQISNRGHQRPAPRFDASLIACHSCIAELSAYSLIVNRSP
jgi:hypothetical protein